MKELSKCDLIINNLSRMFKPAYRQSKKLEKSLNLKGASKGLEDVNVAAKNCNMTPLSNAVETVKMRFSALEVMAMTALSNITNSALNAGKILFRH